MKVLHVVTLVSPDGAFGGPVRVALNLARVTRSEGHEAVVVAATRGWSDPPNVMDGVPVRLFRARRVPGLGLAGISAPGLILWMIRHAAEFDVVHIHFARDLVTVPAAVVARSRRSRLILQTHGQIDRSERLSARLLDGLLVRSILRAATAVLDLTDQERRDVTEVARSPVRSVRLINGVPVDAGPRSVSAAPFPSVLFLSRLHPRKRPLVFVDMAVLIHERMPAARFALVGPDEGELAEVRRRIDAAGAGDYIRYEGALAPDQTAHRLAEAHLLVLPSVSEVFPMAVLEALGAGVPVVIGDSAAMAQQVMSTGAGAVPSSDDAEAYAAAVLHVIERPDLQATAAKNARRLAEREYSLDAVGRELLRIYRGSGPSADHDA